jgi:hypothetical protein
MCGGRNRARSTRATVADAGVTARRRCRPRR